MNSSNSSKILQVLYSGLGGHGSVVYSLIDSRVMAGFRHSLLFFGIEPVREEYLVKARKVGASAKSVLKRAGIDVAALVRLFRFCQAERPNVVISHSPSAILPLAVWRFSRRGLRLLVVEHQPIPLRSRMEWIWSIFCLAAADRIVLLTEAYKAEFCRRLPLFTNKVVVIPNGIDTDRFSRETENGSAGGAFRLGMAARFTRLKGHTTLIHAFALLCESNPDITFTLDLAGAGETEPDIRQEIERRQLSDRVRLPGLLDEDDLLQFFKGLDIYVHCSAGETMSTSIMQAMACGLPVVGSSVEGITNMIDDGETGILVKAMDPADLAHKITLLIQDPHYGTRLGQSARQHAVKHFSSDTMAKRYLDCFA